MAASSESQRSSLREEIEGAFGKISSIFTAALGPVNAAYPHQPLNERPEIDGSLLSDLQKMGLSDAQTLLETLQHKAQGWQDDADLNLEKLVTSMAKLPADSKFAKNMTDTLIDTLWDALPHPPTMSLGKEYKYRSPDGYGNNIFNPTLGQAGQPYARSVKPEILQNTVLPDPGDIFDELLDRGDKFEEHPNKISSMLFYLASIIIHDLFRTSHEDFSISKTSSYLDLSPLYGNDWEEQKLMRTFKDGKIKPDCFSEKRLLGFPPGVGALLIMFNRYHNSIVTMLAAINENNRFPKPKEGDSEEKWTKYDHDLFNTARLVTCGLYVNIILKDYVRTILNLNRTNSTWALDPRSTATRTMFNVPTPEAGGNSVSAEFNLIYRWHSALSDKDDKWTQAEYEKLFPGQDPTKMTLKELIGGLHKLSASLPADPQERPFGGLTRQEDGTFPDDGLVQIVKESIEDCAGSFGANRVPTIMRSVEILGIMQARQWNLGSLNEFRRFFSLKPHETFEDINPDPLVAQKLKNLYDSPDFVELYPGLVAEKAKPVYTPGSGLCVNFTISRAILSDAVSLVRGDRFYTTDFTGANLTNYGITACNSDSKIDLGHVMYKLVLGAFPNHFKGNSIYAHFPFVTPDENLRIHDKLKTKHMYSWDVPKHKPHAVEIKSYAAATAIMKDKDAFKVTWGESIRFLVSDRKTGTVRGDTYCLAGDASANEESRKLVMKALYPAKWNQEVKSFYEGTTQSLLEKYQYKIAGHYCVDVARDIALLAHTHFSASLFSLPLKTKKNPMGIYTEQELSQVLSVLFFSIFYDVDPVKSHPLKQSAKALVDTLGGLVMMNVESVSRFGIIAELVEKLHTKSALTEYGTHMIHRLLESGLNIKDVVWGQLLPTASSMVANQAQLFCQVLEYYLTDGKEHLGPMRELALKNDAKSDEVLLHYFMEGARLRHTCGLGRVCVKGTDLPKSEGSEDPERIEAGTPIFLNLVQASLDENAFPDALVVKLDRPMEKYIHYGYGPHECAGIDASKVAMVTMLKQFVSKKNLRLDKRQKTVDGKEGFRTVTGHYGYKSYLKNDGSGVWPVPVGLVVNWDEE